MDTKSVLIVDDDRIIREELHKEMKRQYFRPLMAADGTEALERFRQEEVDIVLLDVKLPDMDGLEVLKRMKEERPGSEVIVITGLGSQEIAIRSLRAGAIDYIEKPINMDELSAALGRAQEKLEERNEIFYKNRLLLIDDEKDIAEFLKRVLEKEGYEVLVAYNGHDGLRLIETKKIDVLITDIKMQDMDGIEVLHRAKQLYRDIEGIVITGFKDQDLAIRSLRAGAVDYITKPVNLDEILLSIQRAIERINLNRDRLYRNRELKISSEIISKMNEELERRIDARTKELTQTQAQLFQTSKLATLGEMSAGLAHEMNQPLGGISLVAKHMRKLMERERLSEGEIDSGLKDIEASVKRMSKVIQHIRTFARQDTFKFSEVDVNETIDSALSLLGEQLRLHEIEVVRELNTGLPKIMGEPYQLEQVWINMITNARDALDEKGRRVSEGKEDGEGFRKQSQDHVEPSFGVRGAVCGGAF